MERHRVGLREKEKVARLSGGDLPASTPRIEEIIIFSFNKLPFIKITIFTMKGYINLYFIFMTIISVK